LEFVAVRTRIRSTNPEIDNSITHTFVATFALLAFAGSVLAVGVALYKQGDAAVVATRGVASGARSNPIDFGAKPDDQWTPFDPALQPAPDGTEHAIILHARETKLEIAPGVTQEMWTFNGQVPAPILRGKIGDIFTVTLVNDGNNGHSLDFHASEVSPDVEMRTIGPGESLVYQFQATHSGIWMYHCGTPPVLHHVGNGMYGAVVIDPPGLAPVDHEFVFVQSDLYVNGVSQGGYQRMLNDRWDAVVFNGYANQYLAAPIRVEPGQTIRAWVLDAGPSENSSFHVIGTIFDTVYREGHYELRADESHGGSQTLDLQPAQGGFVEFTLDHRGSYPFLTHKLSSASKGALGLLQAGEPTTSNGASHAGH
jgi:nitrite reductase (NO-forming)